MTTEFKPSLPYNGTSGSSGTDTSHTRAKTADGSGTTASQQSNIMDLLQQAGSWGMTIAELRKYVPEHHHGTLSGSLSCLHKEERISRLVDSREGCKIYVRPDFEGGRETEQQGRGRSDLEVALDYWMSPEDVSVTGRTTTSRARKYPARFVTEMERLAKR